MAEVSDDRGPSQPVALVAAPHGGRLIAFGLDLVVVLLVGLVVGGGWPILVLVFVGYHTMLVWLTGQTVGKAVANLEVRRVDGHAFEQTAKGLAWTLGRSSIGYLLVDMLGLGVLVALPRRNAQRQCLHDMVFRSRVVLRGETEWALPKLRKRLSDFATRREDASQAVGEAHETPRRLNTLWQWLITGALGLEKVLDVVQSIVTQVSSWFGGASQAHAGGAALSTKAAAGVAVGSGAATVATVTVIAAVAGGPAMIQAPELNPVGRWGVADTNRVVLVIPRGGDRYEGTNANDYKEPTTGCTLMAQAIQWNFQAVEGEEGYRANVRTVIPGSDADPCALEWSYARFRLDTKGTDDQADDVLRICATLAGVEPCTSYVRR